MPPQPHEMQSYKGNRHRDLPRSLRWYPKCGKHRLQRHRTEQSWQMVHKSAAQPLSAFLSSRPPFRPIEDAAEDSCICDGAYEWTLRTGYALCALAAPE